MVVPKKNPFANYYKQSKDATATTNTKRKNALTSVLQLSSPPALVTPKVSNINKNLPTETPATCIRNKESEVVQKSNQPTLEACVRSNKSLRDLRSLHTVPRVYTKPPEQFKWSFGNRLIHVESLQHNIESCAVCKFCGGGLALVEKKIGIATTLVLCCKKCNSKKATTTFHSQCDENSLKYGAVDSFSINRLLVIALQQIGGGATESGILLTYLGLPSAQTFQKSHFGTIEKKIRTTIKQLTNSSISIALDEEMRLTLEDNFEGEELMSKLNDWKQKKLKNDHNGLTVCYDMGWNKRSTGTRYDSISGQGIMIGARSGKVIDFRTISKKCGKCDRLRRALELGPNESVPDHDDCVKNHDGSSKSMECQALLMMGVAAPTRGFHLGCVVADDDTTMKKIMRWNYKSMIENGKMKKEEHPVNKDGKKISSGDLPSHIPEPSFLADFNHRVKSVGKAIYELAMKSKKESTVSKDLAKRIKYYWSCVLNQLRDLDIEADWEEIERKMRAPLEHLFDDHTYCDEEWCYSLQAKSGNHQYITPSNKHFYCKQKDEKMHHQLEKALERFKQEGMVK